MNPKTWQEIKMAFNEAVELADAARDEFIAALADTTVRREVVRLLNADNADRFKEPVANVSTLWIDEPTEDLIGREIGEFRVVREIGRGGMGIVFEAVREKDDFTQRVALKILKRGMDSEAMLRRFRHERQILASLDHPNIARLLDGGMTSDGLSYLAMEFVEGYPLDEFCAVHQPDLTARLRIFLDICAAVQFAHSRLVVHRDLKPRNILVAENGSVKLLDFGIAKIVSPDDDARHTVTSLGMMTPAYASPEQIRGEIVSTSSDIYSLGLVLYEFLTNAPAFRFPNNRPDEMAKIICEIEPPRPSSVIDSEWPTVRKTTSPDERRATDHARRTGSRSLRGDLDNIVLKALRKEPERRYISVEQFAGDIARHLSGLPVIARPDTFSYRLEKFVARNRVSVFAAVLIALTLIGGIVATSWQARRAEQQRILAEKRFDQVRELANNVIFKYHDQIKDLQGSTEVRRVLVEDALRYLDNLRAESDGDRELTRELALAYLRIGNVQGGAYQANLGDSVGAAASYEQAISLLEPLTIDSSDVKTLAALRDAYTESGRAFFRVGEFDKQTANLQKGFAVSERLVALDPSNIEHQIYYSRSLVHFGDSIADAEMERKMDTYRRALVVVDGVIAKNPDDETANRMLATATHRMQLYIFLKGESARRSGDRETGRAFYSEALGHARRSREAQQKVLSMKPDSPLFQRNVAGGNLNEGKIYRELGETETALRLAREALAILRSISQKDPDNQEIKLDLKEAHEDMAFAFVKSGDGAAAAASFQKAAELAEELIAKDSGNWDFWLARLRGEQEFGRALFESGNVNLASEHLTIAFRIAEDRAPAKFASKIDEFKKQLAEDLAKL